LSKQRILEAEQAARNTLRKAGIATLPIDLQEICKAFNLECLERELDDELSGMSFIRGGKNFVVVNASHHQNRKRFTMAHEIAHHILHADYLSKNVHVDKAVLRRDELSSEGVYSKEIEANSFAAELLMPRADVQKLTSLDLSDQDTVVKEADRFGVSATALTYRISNLANRRG
jgi:Zn-dependent peptidase ImmA (M78 family)